MTSKTELQDYRNTHRLSVWTVRARDMVLGLLGFTCLFMATYQAWNDKLAASGILFTAGLILIVFSSLSRFESIKGLGIEAKMVTIDQKIDEFEKIKESMRNIVGMSADVSFQLMGRINRWDSAIPRVEARAIAKGFKKQLLELGDTEERINQLMAPWHESNMRDLMEPIHQALMDVHQLENQRIVSQSSSLNPTLAQDDPQRSILNVAMETNKVFLESVNLYWSRKPEDFLAHVDELAKAAPAADQLESQKLITKLAPFIADAKFYSEHKDFRD